MVYCSEGLKNHSRYDLALNLFNSLLLLTAKTNYRSTFPSGRDLRNSFVKRYPEIADQLQYISRKVDQLTSAEKEELREAGKEVPPTPDILVSDDEEEDEDNEETTTPIAEQEPDCIDLTKGGDDAPTNPPTIPGPAEDERKKKLAVKIKQERIDQNRAAEEGAGQATQPTTSEGIFSGCKSFQKI